MTWRKKSLLLAAAGQPCVLCGRTGTTVSAHANSVALGKGTGHKAPDYYVAWVCQRHHDMIDGRTKLEPPYGTAQELWLWAYVKTVAVWFEHGLVTWTR